MQAPLGSSSVALANAYTDSRVYRNTPASNMSDEEFVRNPLARPDELVGGRADVSFEWSR